MTFIKNVKHSLLPLSGHLTKRKVNVLFEKMDKAALQLVPIQIRNGED